jgi:hypothetical protein
MKDLRAVPDDDLLAELARLVGNRHRVTAGMLLHLGEVEERRLHLRAAFSSMFEFCVRKLGMSEGEAYRHLVAARLSLRFPLVIDLVETGKIHLSGLALLRDYLTPQNNAELLEQAAGKTTRAIEVLIAARFPKPDARDLIRRLPSQRRATSLERWADGVQPTLHAAGSPSPASPARIAGQDASNNEAPGASAGSGREGAKGSMAPESSAQSGHEASKDTEAPGASAGSGREGAKGSVTPESCAQSGHEASKDTGAPEASSRVTLEPARDNEALAGQSPVSFERVAGEAGRSRGPGLGSKAPPPGRIEPLSEARYRVQFTASQELVNKLEHAKDLLSHQNPTGELAVIVARGVELLIAQLEKSKLGKSERPGRIRQAQHGAVTRAARREVFQRDGLRCAYVDASTGRRCEQSAFLEVDHKEPRGCGGSAAPEKLRVLCRAHNRLHAEDVYGREFIEERIQLSTSKVHRRLEHPSPEPESVLNP